MVGAKYGLADWKSRSDLRVTTDASDSPFKLQPTIIVPGIQKT